MAQTHAYRLLPHQVSAAQIRMDSLVSALWDRIFPRLHFGPNHKLERIFARMLHHPECSAMQICPYYFDQVTWRLPAASPWQNNLKLHCFESWTDLQKEKQRIAEKNHRGETNPGTRPNTGFYLSRLCQLQDLQTGGSITTQMFIHLMYDYSG
ncbi:hypothetical protein CRENBAI_011769 [Crenichthys baileyi]|uniref:Uncharacterized protein n=1 Tax=Crenichthys baileyi TaxID=28760 RepID=A0AAV9RYE8_9TELE